MIVNPGTTFYCQYIFFVFEKSVYYEITAEHVSSRIIMLSTSGSYTEALTGQTLKYRLV